MNHEAIFVMEFYWLAIAIIVLGSLAGAFVVQTFFPMGKDNKRHYIYGGDYKHQSQGHKQRNQ